MCHKHVLWLSYLVGPMHGLTATAPAMADGGTRSPTACDNQLQILRVFDGGDETCIVVRSDRDWQGQGPLPSPVTANLEVAYLASCHSAQATVHFGTTQ